MKRFNVRYAETFLWDMIDITLYLLDKTESVAVSKRFYDNTLQFIEERSFGADSHEPYYPYDDSPEHRRLYYGNYTIFYVIDGDDMDIRRILWSGADDIDKL